MAAKPMILRELDDLPAEALEEVAKLIARLKKCRDKTRSPNRNGKLLAKRQRKEIKRWAGKKLAVGFTGRDHDIILYGENG